MRIPLPDTNFCKNLQCRLVQGPLPRDPGRVRCIVVQDEAGGDGPSQGSQAFASAVRVLVGSGEYLGSSPERQFAGRCVIEERDGLEPARPGRGSHEGGVRRRAGPLQLQRRLVAAVGRVQPGRRGVRRGGRRRGGRQRRDLADQRVPPVAMRLVGRPQRERTARTRPSPRCASPAARRRRPRRAPPPASSAGRPARWSCGGTGLRRRERREVLGRRRRHRREQLGEGAAVGPAGGVDEARLELASRSIGSPRSRRTSRRVAARCASPPSSPSRTSTWDRWACRRGATVGRSCLNRREAWSTATAAPSRASTSSTSASSGVCSGSWATDGEEDGDSDASFPPTSSPVSQPAASSVAAIPPSAPVSAVRRRTSGRSGSTARPYPGCSTERECRE